MEPVQMSPNAQKRENGLPRGLAEEGNLKQCFTKTGEAIDQMSLSLSVSVDVLDGGWGYFTVKIIA